MRRLRLVHGGSERDWNGFPAQVVNLARFLVDFHRPLEYEYMGTMRARDCPRWDELDEGEQDSALQFAQRVLDGDVRRLEERGAQGSPDS